MKRVDVIIALPQCGAANLIESLTLPNTQIMYALETITSEHIIYAGEAYTHKQRTQIIDAFKGYDHIAHVIQPPQCALDWSQIDTTEMQSAISAMQRITEFECIVRYRFKSTQRYIV